MLHIYITCLGIRIQKYTYFRLIYAQLAFPVSCLFAVHTVPYGTLKLHFLLSVSQRSTYRFFERCFYSLYRQICSTIAHLIVCACMNVDIYIVIVNPHSNTPSAVFCVHIVSVILVFWKIIYGVNASSMEPLSYSQPIG
jgi:hypothetical protein